MTQNYQMVGERYPKPNKVVGGSIRAREIFSILRQEKVGSYASCVPQKTKSKKKEKKDEVVTCCVSIDSLEFLER
jgi:hypothetical protein